MPTPITWDGTDPTTGQPLRWDTPGLTWDGFLPDPQPQPQPAKRMPQLRVSLSFARATDHVVEETAQAVLNGLYADPLWAVPPNQAPPVTQATLGTAQSDLTSAIATAKQGGPADTADKNNKRDALVALLRQLAGHVQANHGNDMAKLLASGFDAVSTSNAPSPLDAPTITDILNGNSGQLIVRIDPIRNARVYEVRYALIGPGGTPGPWQNAGLFRDSRGMNVGGLTPGENYQFQVRAVGGSTGYSDWSDAVSHRSL